MSNNYFDALRSEFEKNPWLARVTAPIVQIVYITEADTFCLADREGNILTHEEFENLIAEVRKFYKLFSEQAITRSNNYRQNSSNGQKRTKGVKAKPAQKVYLMGKGNGHYKIGISSNPKSRLSGMKTVEPLITLLHSFDADDALKAEAELHGIYKSKNVGGEWFDLSGDEITVIKSITKYEHGEFIGETK